MRYVFRIYSSQYSYANYDDNIYRMKETSVNKNDIDSEVFCDNLQEIETAFDENIEIFAGATYCIKDLDKDYIIIGGIMDASDKHVIQNYFNKR